MSAGPTRGATEERSWSPQPARALAVRGLMVAAPIVVSFAVTRFVAASLWHPAGWAGAAVFISQVAVVGSAAALLTDRAVRRLLPLAELFNMTLVFPDRAPSRFGVALRTRTVKQLKKSLDAGDLAWPEDQQKAAEQLVAMVGALGSHHRMTRGHTERVRAYADMIATELLLSSHDREMLHWAAMVHDIGKLAVPLEILAKDGPPTAEEWATLKQHPAAGGEMLEPLAPWLGEWRLAASQHHEHWDGGGYPAGLAGTEIGLAGRIIAVADAFDVITSKRSYKEALSAEAGRREMVRRSGTQFDPDVVRALLNVSLSKNRAALGFLGWSTELAGLSAIPRGVGQAIATTTTAVAVVVGAVGADGLLVEQPVEIVATISTGRPAVQTPSSLNFLDEPDNSTPSSATDESINVITAPPGEQEPTTASVPTTADIGQPTETIVPTTTAETATTSTPSTTTSATTTMAPTTTSTTAPTTASTTATTQAPTTTTTTPGSPLAAPDNVTVEQDDGIKIHVLDNDDPGNAPFDEDTLQITTDPLHSEDFRVHNDHIHYRSIEGYEGMDSLDYRICNTNGLCHSATVSITVLHLDD